MTESTDRRRRLLQLAGLAQLVGRLRLRGPHLAGAALWSGLASPAIAGQRAVQNPGADPSGGQSGESGRVREQGENGEQAFDHAPVRPGTPLRFPADHGAHPGYRTEWWYLTGWLTAADATRAPFQVTFFRTRTPHPQANPSAFAPTQLLFAHAALGWPGRSSLWHGQRASRALPGLAAAESGDTRVWIGPPSDRWQLERRSDDRYRTRIRTRDFELELELRPDAAPWLQGEAGTSRKAADPTRASHYYSRPQLDVSGTVRTPSAQSVRGRAWFDHEWSSELLEPQAVGWDWFGLNLDDGSALMAFRIHDAQGQTLWREGSFRPAVQALAREATRSGLEPVFEVLRTWRSPRTGARYPVELRAHIRDPRQPGFERVLHLVPYLDDQELDTRASTGTVYWEGGVTVFEGSGPGGGQSSPGQSGRRVGQGHLELTGYAGPLRL